MVKGFRIGMWRSLVAHLSGGQGAEGSNPFIPTINLKRGLQLQNCKPLFVFGYKHI